VIKVNFQNLQNRNIKNYILFCKNKFTLNTQELNFFKLKKNDFETLVENNKTENKRFINIDCNSGRKIILINLNEKDTLRF